MAWDLNGRTALITGAASGIGAQLARQLAGRGMRLALLDIDGERLAGVAGALPDGAATATADVRDRAGLDAAVEELAGQLGGFDVAAANAGIATGGPLRLVGLDTRLSDRVLRSAVAPMDEAFARAAERVGVDAAARPPKRFI